MKYKLTEIVKMLLDWESWDYWFPYPESPILKNGFVRHKNGSFYAAGYRAILVWDGEDFKRKYEPNALVWLIVFIPLCIRLERKIKLSILS
jgi:hypothetical protein